MNQRGRIPALLLSLVMVFSAFAVLPLQTAFADGEENIALGKPAYANRNSSNAAVITDGDDTTYWSGREIPLYAEVMSFFFLFKHNFNSVLFIIFFKFVL